MRIVVISFMLLFLMTALACGADEPTQEELRAEVVAALDGLAEELASDQPVDADAYAERLRAYLEAHPAFYGAAAALLDEGGRITASPYVHREDGGYAVLDLAIPSYGIESQAWFTEPLAANAGVWTDPYFDAGGGEIWMVTRSVPVRNGGSIFTLVTTDLPVEGPGS